MRRAGVLLRDEWRPTSAAAVRAGATDDAIEGVDVVTRPALVASTMDVLTADSYLLGTPVNIGYMSGALKHFFDQKLARTMALRQEQ